MFATVLSAYSASMEQRNVSAPIDMQTKLKSVSDDMFQVTHEEKVGDKAAHFRIHTGKSVSCTVRR